VGATLQARLQARINSYMVPAPNHLAFFLGSNLASWESKVFKSSSGQTGRVTDPPEFPYCNSYRDLYHTSKSYAFCSLLPYALRIKAGQLVAQGEPQTSKSA